MLLRQAPSWVVSAARARKTSGSFRVVGLSILLGIVTGLLVIVVQHLVLFLQRVSLGFAAERRFVLPEHASSLRVFLALAIAGVLITFVSRWLSRFSVREPIDAVEANALWGGNMTWFDAAAVVLPILISVCCGASVGIEAAVTQLGACLASGLAKYRGSPRPDRRLLVGAGAAAAIAAAYRAPIAGMLYAYELVLGSYSKRTLAPIGVAAISATIVVWSVNGPAKPFDLLLGTSTIWSDYPIALLIGCLAAITGVTVMTLVTSFERGLKSVVGDESLRRVIVSGIVALLALRFPAVLGSGHAAIEGATNGNIAKAEALELFGAKIIASGASLGAAYRGGLFSASLMMGALLGQSFAWLISTIPGAPSVHPGLCALIGMASVGSSVIGAPLSMIFLALETTGDFDAAVVVAVGAMTAGFLTDRLFGYSFATWRFQQRGLALEGGHDISRLSSVGIADLLRPPKRTVLANAPLRDVVRAISSAGARGTAVYTVDGNCLGLIDPKLVEALDQEDEGVLPIVAAELVYSGSPLVTSSATLADVIEIFRNDDRSTLAVVDPADLRRLVGCIRARDAFAAASAVLDQQRRDDLGMPG